MADLAIAIPIWICLVCYPVAVAWPLGSLDRIRCVRRGFWTAACIAYLAHAAAAFHFVHGWSHARAFQHVADGSGFGQGIYITYAFTALWPADVLWNWMAPDSYHRRSRWVSGAVHGFTAFMLFNGAIVFATGFSRALGIAAFVVAGVFWAFGRRTGLPA